MVITMINDPLENLINLLSGITELVSNIYDSYTNPSSSENHTDIL